jgi:hypothetical protein
MHCLLQICYFVFSNLFPLQKHFFHLKLVDSLKRYRPESQIVLDITTAYNFFGRNPLRTKAIVVKKVHQIVEAWNEKYIKRKEVKLNFVFLFSILIK